MQENTTSVASPLEQPKRRGRKPSVVIDFRRVRIIKSYLEKSKSLTEAAAEAEMSVPTFYRYTKMGLPELIKLAQKTQYESMTPDQRAAYEKKLHDNKDFDHVLANVNRALEARAEERRKQELKKAEEYAKLQQKRPIKSKVWGNNKNNKVDANLIAGQETKCYICDKVFLMPDRLLYAYKASYDNHMRYCCSHACLCILKRRIKGKKRK